MSAEKFQREVQGVLRAIWKAFWPLCLLGGLVAANCTAGEKSSFAVKAVSSRPGHLFTDSEPLAVRVRVSDSTAAAAVEFTISESGGPWTATGRVEVMPGEDGTGEEPLPLKVPGRGLYRLKLTATAGAASSTQETWVAVVFTPPPPDPASPWGIFYVPRPDNAQDASLQLRLLGASWARLNFWAHSFEKVAVTNETPPRVEAEYGGWKRHAQALRAEHLSIMGEIAQCPTALSSRPNEKVRFGDAGELANRVKPLDYALWDQLMEKLAADFREEIGVWEIWNEADLKGRYWAGSPEEFAELVEHTAAALRRGNPKTKIAAAGFAGGYNYAEKLFKLGMDKHVDILSVHYTNEISSANAWRNLLKKKGLQWPVWNTEEKSEVPLRNLAQGVERTFKFIHVGAGYDSYRPLARKDLTILPAGILYSVGAHCIGTAKCTGTSNKVPGHETYFFQRDEERMAVFNALRHAPRLFGAAYPRAVLAVEPLAADRAVEVTDTWGRSAPLAIRDGQTEVELKDRYLFVTGARKLELVRTEPAEPAAGTLVVEAEEGRWSKGWNGVAHEGYSGGRTLDINASDNPDEQGYWVELKARVPADGEYEILFVGNTLTRLKAPRSLSTFSWSLDDGAEHDVNAGLPNVEGVLGANDGVNRLGTAELKAGEHTFRLKLSGRREVPDKRYALWFDALVLRAQKP